MGIRRTIKKVLRPSLYTWEDVSTAFVISTGRTGTKFLASTLSRCFRGVKAIHEPDPDLFELGVDYARGLISREIAAQQLLAGREHICESLHVDSNDYYIETNACLNPMVDVVAESFPTAKIVHVIRDPRDYVRSAYSWRVRSSGGGMTYYLSDDDLRRRITSDDVDESGCQWQQLNRFQRCCWSWMHHDSLIRTAIAGSERALTIKFETLVAGDLTGFEHVVDFLGLADRQIVFGEPLRQLLHKRVNSNREYLLPAWTDWSQQHRREFDALVGPYMEECGYQL